LGSNVTIPLAFTFGNQTIWVSEGYVIIGGSSSLINNVNLNNVNKSFRIKIVAFLFVDIFFTLISIDSL
jgi:hypothetical protein